MVQLTELSRTETDGRERFSALYRTRPRCRKADPRKLEVAILDIGLRDGATTSNGKTFNSRSALDQTAREETEGNAT
jgi:hypothetical protein